MARRRHTPEQILARLRELDVMLAHGKHLREVAKALKKENTQLKLLVAEQALEDRALKDLAEEEF